MGGAGFGGGADAFSDIFGDVFGDIFGAGRRGGRNQVFRGADLRYELELTLEQAVAGDSVSLEIPGQTECGRCGGKGAEPGSQPVTCKTCGGQGQVRVAQGFFSIQQSCPNCGGSGSLIGQSAGRRRQRRPNSIGPRRRSRAQRRAAWRPLRRHLRNSASDFHSRGPEPELRGAGQFRDCRARRCRRRADARRQRRA